MVKEILLPDLGEGIDGADVSEVVVSVGDTVSKDDTLLVLESDKASMEIPPEDAGVIKEILVSHEELQGKYVAEDLLDKSNNALIAAGHD